MSSSRTLRVLEEDLKMKYHSAYRVEMKQVLENWDSGLDDQKTKVLENYLNDLEANIHRPYESKADFVADFDILKEIKSKLDVYDRKYLIEEYKSTIQFYRANKQLFQVKAIMLDFVKSQMKAATMSDFYNLLVHLPDEVLMSKAKTMEFCECLLDLDIPEERKRLLVQKTTAESDIMGAYDEARKAVKRNKVWESQSITSLQKVTGDDCQEEVDKLTDEEPYTADMDALNKRLKAIEVEIEEAKGNISQVRLTRNPCCDPKGSVQISIGTLDMAFTSRLRAIEAHEARKANLGKENMGNARKVNLGKENMDNARKENQRQNPVQSFIRYLVSFVM